MERIKLLYGPFTDDEINFYLHELGDFDAAINPFQKKLIFNLFFKFFGDTQSANAINRIDYIILMIAAKRILLNNNMVMLPYIISSRVDKLIGRKTVNKRDLVKIESSSLYPEVLKQYQEPVNQYLTNTGVAYDNRIIKDLLGMIGTVLSSDFTIIDYNDPEINGKKIEVIPDIIIEEFLMFILLCRSK